MKRNQIQTRMFREHIEIIAELARASHMTPAAMLRRLVLERLEQLAQTPQGLEPAASGSIAARLKCTAGKGESK